MVFLPGLRLPFQLHSITALGQYQFILLSEQRHVRERHAQDHCMTAEQLETELASSRLLAQCPTYCTTTAHNNNT